MKLPLRYLATDGSDDVFGSTQPVGPDRQAEVWIRGKVLGGSTAVNGEM